MVSRKETSRVRNGLSMVLVAYLLVGCAHTGDRSSATVGRAPSSQLPVGAAYDHAVDNAALAVGGKITHNLIAITRDNENLVWKDSKLLVVTWKSQKSYEENLIGKDATSPNEAWVVWVTAAPQVQRLCQDYWRNHPEATIEDVELRLKQYLGLNPDWQYQVFVELWVDPDDLFRPCVDPETTDRSCQLKFDDAKPPKVKEIADYPAFYKNLYFSDFRYAPGVPWTGLGYTYDWGNMLTIEGASEFIIRPGAPYAIQDAIPTADYCKPGVG